jgi:hypothetical protein
VSALVLGFQRRDVVLGAVTAAWVSAVMFGMATLWRFKNSPGPTGSTLARWPAGLTVAHDPQRPTLMMFAHPHCPCTRASIAELARMSARLGERVRTYVAFIKPQGTGANWFDTDLWQSAKLIPGVEVIRDDDGALAARFDAQTSGKVVLYGPDGTLWFSGGLTSARGHEGASPGQTRILELVNHGSSELATAPVFGCHLQDPTSGGGSP